jgi:ATP-binding cassette subfamily B protein
MTSKASPDTRQTESWHMLRKLIMRYIRPYIPWLVGVLLLQLVAAVCSLYMPTLNADIIDKGVAVGDTHYIWQRGGIMLLVGFAQALGQVAAAYCGGRASMSFGRDARGGLFDHVLNFSTREVKQFGAPTLITRNTNDILQVQQVLFMSCTFMVSAPIMAIGGVIMALQQDVALSWIILVAVVVLGAVMALLMTRMVPLFRRNQVQLDSINRVLREQISGIRVIRAFVREKFEDRRFNDVNSGLMGLGYKIGSLFAVAFPLVNLVMNGSSSAVMWFGGIRVDNGDMQVGQLTAFLNYLIQILISVMMATMMFIMIPRAQVSAGRIMDVLNTDSTVLPPQNPVEQLPESGHVKFQDVAFSYPGAKRPVISGLDFELKPGTTTAVIGAIGSGKTTLVNLVPRLYDATEGAVLVDDINVKDIDPDVLWARVGFVPQKAYLFSGTVASNLRYGNPDATDDEMWKALEVAQADDFVKGMDGQLEAEIAQGGTNVSGGQRQRLSIARALIKQPEILVFDDAFSALDVATDARLRAALKDYAHNAAVLIVAQRVSSIMTADQILVLDRGTIVGKGTHEELLQTCPTYQEIVKSQMNAAEAIA